LCKSGGGIRTCLGSRMRDIAYRPVPGVGGGIGEPRTVSLADFLRRGLPYVLAGGAAPRPWWVPPRAVLNSLFGAGSLDAGMSGGARWEPFEIDEVEYDALVQALAQHGYEPVPAEPPAWVKNGADWRIWADELRSGVPSEEHRRLQARADDAYAAWRRSWDEAVEKRDPTIPPRRFKEVTSALRAVEDLRAGRDPGATDASAQTEPGAVPAGTLLEARMAARAAERIGDPELIEEWRRREASAARALARVANEAEAALLQARVAAVDWRSR
jgi:hypothetical protein